MSSLTRTMKRKRGWRTPKPYNYCRTCKVLMDEKQGYGYICNKCGKFKPYDKESEVKNNAQ